MPGMTMIRNAAFGTLVSIFNVYVCFVSSVTSFKDSTCFKIHTKILVLYIFIYEESNIVKICENAISKTKDEKKPNLSQTFFDFSKWMNNSKYVPSGSLDKTKERREKTFISIEISQIYPEKYVSKSHVNQELMSPPNITKFSL